MVLTFSSHCHPSVNKQRTRSCPTGYTTASFKSHFTNRHCHYSATFIKIQETLSLTNTMENFQRRENPKHPEAYPVNPCLHAPDQTGHKEPICNSKSEAQRTGPAEAVDGEDLTRHGPAPLHVRLALSWTASTPLRAAPHPGATLVERPE